MITVGSLYAQTPTVASLTAISGAAIKWYLETTGGTALDAASPLVNAQHYWASQTINGVESIARFEVTANVTPCITSPEVTNSAVTDIGGTIATQNGNITAIKGANATIRGFRYCITDGFNPETPGTNISASGTFGIGAFSLSPLNLISTTTYYVVAYATNSAGTTYGSQVTFTTVGYTLWTFTNASATGWTGPMQTQINTAYAGTSLQSSVTINTQWVQELTVPTTGTYRMSVKGAGGGANYYTQRVRGGYGTQMTGDFALTAGQVIKVAVGQCGLDGTNNNYAIDPNPQEAGGSAGGAGYSGGGGSVNNGSNQSNTAGFNNGNDQVIITRL